MTFDLAVNGRTIRVLVERTDVAGRFGVTVEGVRRLYDTVWVDSRTLSLITLDGDHPTVHEFGFSPDRSGLLVTLDGGSFRAEKDRGRAFAGGSSLRRHGAGIVRAPMPGRVMRVLVALGEQVRAGQAVVVMEAMKMENELRADADGVVRQLHVSEGEAVEAGAVLVRIE